MKAHWQKFLQASKLMVVLWCAMTLAGCETERDRSMTYKLWNNRSLNSSTSGNLKRAALAPLLVALTPITATGDVMTGAMSPTPATANAMEATGEVIYWASFMWLLAGAPGVNY